MARIVVVDDDRPLVELLAVILTDLGHAVQRAYNGEAALALIRAAPPNLLITDLMLPLLSGGQVISALQADAVLQAIPVIVLTALPERRGALPPNTVQTSPHDPFHIFAVGLTTTCQTPLKIPAVPLANLPGLV